MLKTYVLNRKLNLFTFGLGNWNIYSGEFLSPKLILLNHTMTRTDLTWKSLCQFMLQETMDIIHSVQL